MGHACLHWSAEVAWPRQHQAVYGSEMPSDGHADSGKVLQTRCIAAIPCMSALPPCPLTGAQVTAANCCWIVMLALQ